MITWEQVIDQMDQFESNVSRIKHMMEMELQDMQMFRQRLEKQVKEEKAFGVEEN